MPRKTLKKGLSIILFPFDEVKLLIGNRKYTRKKKKPKKPKKKGRRGNATPFKKKRIKS